MMIVEGTGYEAFRLFHALKLHFTTNYDFVKYHGKIKLSKDTFEKRADRFHYYRLSRKYRSEELFRFLLANFLKKDNVWIGELFQDDAVQCHKKWEQLTQSLSYIFSNEIETAFNKVENLEDLLIVIDGQYPLLYNLYLRNEVSMETVIILNDILGFFPMWSKKVVDDILFPKFIFVCEKYKPFLSYDLNKMRNIVKEKMRHRHD